MGHVVGMHLVVELPLATLELGFTEMLFSGWIRFTLCHLVMVCARQLALSHTVPYVENDLDKIKITWELYFFFDISGILANSAHHR